jgi:hypothetical protein
MKTFFTSGAGRRLLRGLPAGALAIAVLLALAGCGPVDVIDKG